MYTAVFWFAFLLSSLLSNAASAQNPDANPAGAQSQKTDAEAAQAKLAAEPVQPEADFTALADTPVFLPRNYFYWGTPVGPPGHREPLVFGLDYALHLPIYNNVRDKLLVGKSWAGAVTLSFEGALRMLATDSDPVRMPSYRPSFSGQVFYAWHRKQPLLIGLRPSIYHYSNGQERCAFDAKLSDTSQECLDKISSTRDLRESLNRSNGNFSTTGWLLELHARLHGLNSRGVAVSHIDVGFGYAGVLKRFPGSLDAPTRALYGQGRFELSLEVKRRMGWASMTGRTTVFHFIDDDPRVPSTSGQTEVVLAPYWLSGLGLFARYRAGRDSYNAFFVDRLQQFSFGLAWDGEQPLKFKHD